MKRQHTLIVMVEDHPGVLNRVVSLLRRRSFNIDSITVGHSEQPGVSRMTIVVRGTDADIEQASKQLYKLMEVLKVIDLTDQPVVAHEMAIVKVAAKAQQRQEVLLVAQMFNARVLDASPNTIMIEATGPVEQIESLLVMLRAYGIRELARTGAIAMTKGSGIITSKGLGGSDRYAESAAAD